MPPRSGVHYTIRGQKAEIAQFSASPVASHGPIANVEPIAVEVSPAGGTKQSASRRRGLTESRPTKQSDGSPSSPVTPMSLRRRLKCRRAAVAGRAAPRKTHPATKGAWTVFASLSASHEIFENRVCILRRGSKIQTPRPWSSPYRGSAGCAID